MRRVHRGARLLLGLLVGAITSGCLTVVSLSRANQHGPAGDLGESKHRQILTITHGDRASLRTVKTRTQETARGVRL